MLHVTVTICLVSQQVVRDCVGPSSRHCIATVACAMYCVGPSSRQCIATVACALYSSQNFSPLCVNISAVSFAALCHVLSTQLT